MEGNYDPAAIPVAVHKQRTSGTPMLMPPPNVTGTHLHLGHALNLVVQDAYLRGQGPDVCWVPGFDHAGIATQSVIHRKHPGASVPELRQAAVDFAASTRETMRAQIEAMGIRPAWDREYYTLDGGHAAYVNAAFVELHRRGLIYREKKLINWSLKLQTTVSDIEVYTVPEGGTLYTLRFSVGSGHIDVATTRPETCLGDVALAVNGSDDRYRHLRGARAMHPLLGHTIPIIHDDGSFIDPEFGTGAIKVTPAHDATDWALAQRHGLRPVVEVFDEQERVRVTGPWLGLSAAACRQEVLVRLKEAGAVVGEQPYTGPHKRCQRSNGRVVLMLREQWFLRTGEMARRARQAVQTEALVLLPEQHANNWMRWLEESTLQDWCLSRQLWWGHRIPAYRTPEGWVVSVEDVPGGQRDEDVLDTWFSSALLPLSIVRREEWVGPDLVTDVLFTGRDILFFWVARMVMLTLTLADALPFRRVLLHELVRDAQGRKMSKTAGNGLDPVGLVNTYSRDAVRFALLHCRGDMHFGASLCKRWRQWCNKIWHGCKYVAAYPAGPGHDERAEEMVARTRAMEQDVQAAAAVLDFPRVCDRLYVFWQHEFCRDYLEYTKRVRGCSDTLRATAAAFLVQLRPCMPDLAEFILRTLA